MPAERKESYMLSASPMPAGWQLVTSAHGLEAVAIDSRTPASERRELVEDFRRGR